MKRHFLIVALFCIIFSFYTVSALYEGTINVGVGDNVEVTIGDSPSFNVTECTSGDTTCSGTTYYICSDNTWVSQGQVDGQCGYSSGGGTTTGGGGSNDDDNSVSSSGGGTLLSSLSTSEPGETTDNQEEKEEEINKDETEKSRSFFTGDVVEGITNFAQSPGGIATGAILMIGLIGGIIFFNFKKGKFVKNKSKDNSEGSEGENQGLVDEE
jgi:hypothetical protein